MKTHTKIRIPELPTNEWRFVVLGALVMVSLSLIGWSIGGALTALASVVMVAVFVLGWLSTSWGIGAILLTIPIQGMAEIAIGSVSLTWTKLVVAAALAAWGLRVLAGIAPLRFTLVTGVFSILVAVLIVSGVNARDLGAWAGEIYRWVIALLIYIMASSAAKEHRFGSTVLAATTISVAVVTAIALAQVVTGAGPASYNVDGLTRAYAAFGAPNPFAAYLEMTVPLLAVVVLARLRVNIASRKMTAASPVIWLYMVVAISGVIALFLTQSRGGLLGFFGAMAVALLLLGKRSRWLLFVGAGFVGVLLLLAPVVNVIGGRVSLNAVATRSNVQVTPANFAVQERLAHWKAGVAMLEAYPILGVGAGNFSARFREFTPVWRFRISRGQAHNSYIQIAAQSGLTGLATYLALLAVILLRLGGRLRHVRPQVRPFLIGVIGITVAIMIHGMFDYLHVLSLGIQLSVVWALSEWTDAATQVQPVASE